MFFLLCRELERVGGGSISVWVFSGKTDLHGICPREELCLQSSLKRKSKSAPEGGANVNNHKRFELFLEELCVNLANCLLRV